MKNHSIGGTLVFAISCAAPLLSAQNLECAPSSLAAALSPDQTPVYLSQDSQTLENRRFGARGVETIIDLKLLREPSAYRKWFVRTEPRANEALSEDLKAGLDLIYATYRELGKSSACPETALSVGQQIKLDPAQTLEIVSRETAANPGCACEIVKAAIRANEADDVLVADIVEAAITAAPETLRIVSQCAIAEVPEALSAVQAVLAKLDPGAGESGYSSKGAKSAKAAAIVSAARTPEPPQANPLDLPPLYLIPLPPIMPPMVTYVDP